MMSDMENDESNGNFWEYRDERVVLSSFTRYLPPKTQQGQQQRNGILDKPYEEYENPEISPVLKKSDQNEDSPRTATDIPMKQKGKKNPYPTKNMMQYLFKQLRNRYKNSKNQAIVDQLKRINLQEMKPSLSTMRELFCNEVLKEDLTEMFESGWLYRQIVMSGMKKEIKREYIKHIPTLWEGFRKKRLYYLK